MLHWVTHADSVCRLQNKDEGRLTTTSRTCERRRSQPLCDGSSVTSHMQTVAHEESLCGTLTGGFYPFYCHLILFKLFSGITVKMSDVSTKTIRSIDPKGTFMPTKLSTADDQVPGFILLSNSWAPVMWKQTIKVCTAYFLLPKHQNYFKFSNSGNESSFLNVSIQAVHLKWKLDVFGQWSPDCNTGTIHCGAGLGFQQGWDMKPLVTNYTPEEETCCVTDELIGSSQGYCYRLIPISWNDHGEKIPDWKKMSFLKPLIICVTWKQLRSHKHTVSKHACPRWVECNGFTFSTERRVRLFFHELWIQF